MREDIPDDGPVTMCPVQSVQCVHTMGLVTIWSKSPSHSITGVTTLSSFLTITSQPNNAHMDIGHIHG